MSTVTGAGVLCSIAQDPSAFAAALRAGVCGIAADPAIGPDAHLRPRLIARLRGFDLRAAVAARSRLPEALRRAALRLAGRAPLPVQASVAVALQAWEAAGLYRAPGPPPERIGLVVAGHNLGGRYAEEVRPGWVTSPVHLPARYALHFLDTDHVATVSEVLGIRGEGYTVGGASASGNVAIGNAMRLVAAGVVDTCLVLGALTDLSTMELQAFHNLGATAAALEPADPRGIDGAAACRPFDADRAGFVPGQGAACLVLESAESARRRGAPVLGRVAGYAAGLDGNSRADPSVDGERRVMAAAIARAGLAPAQIGYVNTHGTGSPLGDEVEAAALRAVFGPGGPGRSGGPWLNSTKGLVGHCLCAAGVVEAVATLVQLRDGFVHPNANLDRPIDPDGRFVGARPEPARPQYALSNGFGFGGFNTSVVIAGGADVHR